MQRDRTQNHYHNIHFGIEIAHSACEFDLFFPSPCCYFPLFPSASSSDWVCNVPYAYAIVQSFVHHYHNKLYEVIYVYNDSQ